MTYIFETENDKISYDFDEPEEAMTHAKLLYGVTEESITYYPIDKPENKITIKK
jgi:hypothetical protein